MNWHKRFPTCDELWGSREITRPSHPLAWTPGRVKAGTPGAGTKAAPKRAGNMNTRPRPSKLAKFVRQRREYLGIGQRELAKRCHVSATYLNTIENLNKIPGEDTIEALARELAVQFDTLMSFAGRIPSDVAEYVAGDWKIVAVLREAGQLGINGDELAEALRASSYALGMKFAFDTDLKPTKRARR